MNRGALVREPWSTGARALALAALGALAGVATSGGAEGAVRLRLASAVPEGSIWHDALSRWAGQVRVATGGRVAPAIFAGAVEGDAEVVRRLRSGDVEAAYLSPIGLGILDPAHHALAMPWLLGSDEEVAAVLAETGPLLSDRLRERGFERLHWGSAGWYHLFAAAPVRTVRELQSVPILGWPGEEEVTRWYQRNGFRALSLAPARIAAAIESGEIRAAPVTPYAMLVLRWYPRLNHLIEPRMGPAIGGTVVAAAAWRELTAEDRETLRRLAAEVERELASRVAELDRLALVEMKKRGLVVQPAGGADLAADWNAGGGRTATMRETLVPAEVFDRVLRARDAARRPAAAGARP